MTDRKWHDDIDDCVALAWWLEREIGFGSPSDEVANCIRFFESPWKWDREFQLFKLYLAAEGDPHKCERIIEALDEETTAEELMAEWEDEEA